jgi:hypothetical protein
VKGEPFTPPLPEMPAPTSFTAGGRNITRTGTISEGKHGSITLNGGQVLTFKDTGAYYITSIRNTGSVNKFVFDFNNNPTGTIRLYIEGNAELGKSSLQIPIRSLYPTALPMVL